MPEGYPEDGGEGPTLRDDGHASGIRGLGDFRSHEGERNTIDVIDESEAIWSHDDHALGAGQVRQLTLHGSASLSALGETGGENNQTADATACAIDSGSEHCLSGNRKHRAVDPFGQVVDRGQAHATADLIAPGIDEEQIARIVRIFKIAKNPIAK